LKFAHVSTYDLGIFADQMEDGVPGLEVGAAAVHNRTVDPLLPEAEASQHEEDEAAASGEEKA